MPYLKGKLRLVIVALVATALWSITATAMPFIIKIAIDEYIVKGKWNGLIILGIVFVLVILFNSLCSLVMEISCVKTMKKTQYIGHRQSSTPAGSGGHTRRKGNIIPIKGRILRIHPPAHG